MKRKIMNILPIFVMGMALTFVGCDKLGSLGDKSKTEKSDDDEGSSTKGSKGYDDEFSEKALKGEWDVTNAAEALDMDDDDTFSSLDASSTIEFRGGQFSWDINLKGELEVEAGSYMTMTMKMNVTGPYEVDGDEVTMTMQNGDCKVTKLDLDPDLQAQLEMQGMTLNDFKTILNEQYASGFESTISGETEVFSVKNYAGKSMTLKGDSGTVLKLKR